MTKGYDDWERVFDKQVQAALKVSNTVVIEAAKEVLKRVEDRTPVGDPSLWKHPAPKDYKPGTLKASWTLSYNQTQKGVYAVVMNEAPYSERVEFGWSSQAPNGMMRITIKEWPSILDKTAKAYKI
jgi:hypothetical protein